MLAGTVLLEVGQFKIWDGMLYGPALYMQEQGNKKLDGIMPGDDAAFNVMIQAAPGCNAERLVLTVTVCRVRGIWALA